MFTVTEFSSSVASQANTIKDSLSVINTSQFKTCLVLDNSGKLIGTVTDGDIRRALIKHSKLEVPITVAMNSNFRSVNQHTSLSEKEKILKQHRLNCLPELNNDGQIVVVYSQGLTKSSKELPNSALIMAGGMGKRLLPLTATIPKPMLTVGGVPLLERIISSLTICGIKKLYISVNYKAEQIIDYFGDGSDRGASIEYLYESEPLGTGGSLCFLNGKIKEPLIVLNGDLVTDLDFEKLLEFHDANDAFCSMVIKELDYQISYGVIDVGDNLTFGRIDEKPTYKYFINAGIYVFDPRVLEFTKNKQGFPITDLVNRLSDNGHSVKIFPIHEYWRDIGNINDYEKANVDMHSREDD